MLTTFKRIAFFSPVVFLDSFTITKMWLVNCNDDPGVSTIVILKQQHHHGYIRLCNFREYTNKSFVTGTRLARFVGWSMDAPLHWWSQQKWAPNQHAKSWIKLSNEKNNLQATLIGTHLNMNFQKVFIIQIAVFNHYLHYGAFYSCMLKKVLVH